MKLSERTLQVLKNFSTINQSILVRPGSTLKTISSLRTVFTKADVDEVFEREFAIYDLPRFLGTISLFSDPEFHFEDKFVTIASGKQRVNYTYADPSMVTAPPSKEITFPAAEYEFVLTSEQLATISKAGAVLQMPEVAIVGEDGVISIRAVNSADSTADVFSLDVGECEGDFRVIFKPEYLKLIPAEYNVSITSQGISQFQTNKLTYWIATESK